MGDEASDPDSTFTATMMQLRRRNAARLGVTPDELDDMSFSEISRRIAAHKRATYIRSRWFGRLRFRLLAAIYSRFDTRKLMFRYDPAELDAIDQP